jgi:cysteine desulfurase / selenocysteine lyase
MVEIKSKFTFFRSNNIVYLDNAATTQVPDKVIQIVKSSLQNRGNPHRGAHTLATKNEEKIELSRANIARFINCKSEELVFTNNTTDSINLAIDSITELIKKGDEIIIPIGEHHSNLLPFDKLIKKGAILKTISQKDGFINIEELESKLSSKTKIIALQHCSNVLGNIQNVEKIGRIIKKHNPKIIYFVDGAQAVAHIPVDIKKIKCDFYAFSGHKMYAPSGIGGLYVSKKIWPLISLIRQGGGTISNASIVCSKEKSTLVYDKINSLIGLEGGTPNVEGIIGLSEAVSFIRSIGFEEIVSHEQELLKITTDKLSQIEEIKIIGADDLKKKIGVISFIVKDESVKDIGNYLNKRKIAIRYGSHCAFPLIDDIGGETLRISFGCYNDKEDIERTVQELQFYLDKKKGLIKNKNLEVFRDQPYYLNRLPVNKANNVIRLITNSIIEQNKTEVIIQAGHFLAIPDIETNSFYPSIKPLLPERLYGLLEEFGMTSFPLFTWELGCKIVANLKERNIKAKLLIVGNDTTGINELKNSEINSDKKTAEKYRTEFLNRFGNKKIPDSYLEILSNYDLTLDDILKFDNQYYTQESLLRGRFKEFISKNKSFFEGMIEYTGVDNKIDVGVKILDNQEIKTCTFNTFNSKTGGRFCIVEVAQMIAEMFGNAHKYPYKYLHQVVKKPLSTEKEKVFVMLTPEMCNNAVTRGGELYIKLFSSDKELGSFKYFNFQFGPDAEKSLAIGLEGSYLSNKGNLLELEIDNKPDFSTLWKLVEYELLYNIDNYFEEIKLLFNKIKITKKSKILDTCVGPGFLAKELLQTGFNLTTMDKSKKHIKPFLNDIKKLGLDQDVKIGSWLEIPKIFKKESFDFLFNRGNTFIFANGGLLETKDINKPKTLETMKKTLKNYYDSLKLGGYLYIDKYKDSEVPSDKVVAKLKIKETKEIKDVIFHVERNPKEGYRFASIILRDKNGDDSKIFNKVYDLTEDEMETLLQEVGFKVKKINLKSEKHFVVWLAQK